MDSEDIKKQWLKKKVEEENAGNIADMDIEVLHNVVDPNCPIELKTRLDKNQEEKLAAFLRKVQSSIEGDEEFDPSIKSKIGEWQTQIDNNGTKKEEVKK